MTQETPLPDPFSVGKIYEDENGKYKVISVIGARMTFERPDGSRNHSDNIPLKASIHKRILFERDHPRPVNCRQSRSGSGTPEYKYEDVTHLVAAIIDKHSERSREYINHVQLKIELLRNPHASSIIESLRLTPQFRTPEA
jgi:hypothetical protein